MWSYAYALADQLVAAVKATTDPTPTVLSAQAWAYDAAGNRDAEQE